MKIMFKAKGELEKILVDSEDAVEALLLVLHDTQDEEVTVGADLEDLKYCRVIFEIDRYKDYELCKAYSENLVKLINILVKLGLAEPGITYEPTEADTKEAEAYELKFRDIQS